MMFLMRCFLCFFLMLFANELLAYTVSMKDCSIDLPKDFVFHVEASSDRSGFYFASDSGKSVSIRKKKLELQNLHGCQSQEHSYSGVRYFSYMPKDSPVAHMVYQFELSGWLISIFDKNDTLLKSLIDNCRK